MAGVMSESELLFKDDLGDGKATFIPAVTEMSQMEKHQ